MFIFEIFRDMPIFKVLSRKYGYSKAPQKRSLNLENSFFWPFYFEINQNHNSQPNSYVDSGVVKKSVTNGALTFSDTSVQCLEVLWIHNIDTICISNGGNEELGFAQVESKHS